MVLARQGKTEEQIARIVGVSPSTLTYWKQRDLEFFVSLKENKELADEVVEGSLFRRATGYDYTEEASTREGIVELKRHAPPDPTSMIFWLKNRKPNEWKDRREEEHKILLVKQELIAQSPTQDLVFEAERIVRQIKGADDGGDPPSKGE